MAAIARKHKTQVEIAQESNALTDPSRLTWWWGCGLACSRSRPDLPTTTSVGLLLPWAPAEVAAATGTGKTSRGCPALSLIANGGGRIGGRGQAEDGE